MKLDSIIRLAEHPRTPKPEAYAAATKALALLAPSDPRMARVRALAYRLEDAEEFWCYINGMRLPRPCEVSCPEHLTYPLVWKATRPWCRRGRHYAPAMAWPTSALRLAVHKGWWWS